MNTSRLFGHTITYRKLRFVILAFFAMNMFHYIDMKNMLARFFLYLFSGLSIALISEFIQIFIPQRTGRIIDIIIDMGGFLLGTLFVLLCRGIKRRRIF